MQTGESYVLPRALEKGDIVFVRTLGKEGLVLQKPSGNSVRVQAGILKTTVPLTDVTLGHGPGKKNQKQQPMRGLVSTKGIATRSSREIKTELDLRGQDAEQAVLELNQFIDGAILSGVKTICIIHGKGTGVLRAAVARRLRSNPAIATFRLGHYGEGEDGVTIAELK
ncbi:MAG: Smr/MutS family protein, partial [Oscillospiraceae bacterium]